MAVNDCWHGENWTKLVADDETEIDSMGQITESPIFMPLFWVSTHVALNSMAPVASKKVALSRLGRM